MRRAAGSTYTLSCEAQRRDRRECVRTVGRGCVTKRGPRTVCHAKHSDQGGVRRVRTVAGRRRVMQQGPRTTLLPVKVQLVQERVPSFQMAPPYHGSAREDRGEGVRHAAGATYILSCEAQRRGRRATREDGGASASRRGTREDGGPGVRHAAGATYTLSREARRRGRKATREDGGARVRHIAGATYMLSCKAQG